MATASPPEIYFGRALKRERIDAGLTQEKLANSIGMNLSEISVFEAGRRSLQLRTMKRLTDGLGIPLSQIFERAEEIEAEDA
ncbi:MAG TPA: helix-turn-helix transcriptional regulator [Solirubrobacterales bacterium]|jgi:transcriptional regulator with XRE-family HTH domain|nr:helix-turn-helix transcriptional regulator [Solirubrobacterales bacterium]